MAAVLEHPDPAILQALLHYEPGLDCISLDDSHLRCFLPEACTRPPSQIAPVLHVLLDHGADVHDGGFGSNTGALWAAIRCQQPPEIVGKVLARNGPVSCTCALVAIRQADAAVTRCIFDDKVKMDSRVSAEDCVAEAKKRRDTEITGIVQSWAHRRAIGGQSGWGLLQGLVQSIFGLVFANKGRV